MDMYKKIIDAINESKHKKLLSRLQCFYQEEKVSTKISHRAHLAVGIAGSLGNPLVSPVDVEVLTLFENIVYVPFGRRGMQKLEQKLQEENPELSIGQFNKLQITKFLIENNLSISPALAKGIEELYFKDEGITSPNAEVVKFFSNLCVGLSLYYHLTVQRNGKFYLYEYESKCLDEIKQKRTLTLSPETKAIFESPEFAEGQKAPLSKREENYFNKYMEYFVSPLKNNNWPDYKKGVNTDIEDKKLTRQILELGFLLSKDHKSEDINFYIFNDKDEVIGISDNAPENLKAGVHKYLSEKQGHF